MAATDTPAPRLAPSPNSIAAKVARRRNYERQKPIVHSVKGTLDDLGCFAERLKALHSISIDQLGDAIHQIGDVNGADGLNDCWLMLIIAGEKLAELHDLIGATCTKAYADDFAARGAA